MRFADVPETSDPVPPERPDASELRAACRWIVWQYPVPRTTQAALRGVATLADLELPTTIPEPETAELVRRVQRWHAERGGALLLFHSSAYPELLREISHPPVGLFVEGDAAILHAAAVAIVGARAASETYCEWTRNLATDLARFGFVVASGLARGIDAAAHEGALAAGGRTVAVLGCGTDRCYPPENGPLQRRIVADGCLVSELPPGTEPRAWHFPSRNRILAGIVRGVVVVQAEHKSGALITARHALAENREVMAVPGDVLDPRSRGPHALLRQGAALVESAADVLAALGGQDRRGTAAGEFPPPPAAAELLDVLGRAATAEALRSRLGWPPEAVQRQLAELELAGLLERLPDGRWRRRRLRGC
jgi:DNA processing protein